MIPLLYANCIPVRGARRALVCDLQRERYHPIPLGLYEIVTLHRGKSVDEIKALYSPEAGEVIDEYFGWLVENDLAWYCDEPDCFPPLELDWDYPGAVSNAIVDTGVHSAHDYGALFDELDALGCRSLQLRFFVPVSAAVLEAVVALTDAGRLRYLEVLIPAAGGPAEEEIREIMRRHPRLTTVFVHSALENRVAAGAEPTSRIVYRSDVVGSAAHCGYVHPAYFMASLPLFTESQRYNTCLNRKVSVDEHGNIRNCPAMLASYGNTRDTSLGNAVRRPDFQAVWSITKDQVEVCRDCEFRHICTDCRAFVSTPGDLRSKPARCGYDPYTTIWSTPPAPGQLAATSAAADVPIPT